MNEYSLPVGWSPYTTSCKPHFFPPLIWPMPSGMVMTLNFFHNALSNLKSIFNLFLTPEVQRNPHSLPPEESISFFKNGKRERASETLSMSKHIVFD